MRVVAIDGPAASGKGTLARRLATALDLPYLDTGLLYRAIGRRVLDQAGDPDDALLALAEARALHPDDLARTDLRGPAADRAASRVARQPGVRAALLTFQRAFGSARGAVLDGRDIGTVIFPEAPVKLFVTADLETRAHRRWTELAGMASLDTVLQQLRERDAQDIERDAAPLRPAADAVVIDTTTLDAEAAFAQGLAVALERLTPGRAAFSPHWKDI